MKNFNCFFILCSALLISSFKFVEGIVGGEIAKKGQFNYVVSVEENSQHICTGAIINEKFVITAARCFIGENDKFKNKKYSIVAGTINLKAEDSYGIKISVQVIYVPKEFVRINPNPDVPHYHETGDIALLKLNNNLILAENSLIYSVNIPIRKRRRFLKYYKEQPILAGFGADKLNRNEKNFEHLKYAITSIARKNQCVSRLRSSYDGKCLCANVIQRNTDISEGACDGDVGAPLVLDGTLIGILSENTYDCNEKFFPTYYTRVTSFVKFINTIMKNKNLKDARVAAYQNRRHKDGTYSDVQDLIEMHQTM